MAARQNASVNSIPPERRPLSSIPLAHRQPAVVDPSFAMDPTSTAVVSSSFNGPMCSTNSGMPVWNNDNSLTVGSRGTNLHGLFGQGSRVPPLVTPTPTTGSSPRHQQGVVRRRQRQR